MGMPRSIDELSEIDKDAGIVINGVDNANLMSVDSTESIETEPEKEKLSEGDIDASGKELENKKEIDPELDADLDKKKEEEEEKTQGKKDDDLAEDSKNVQKRIGKLTKKMRTAERERDSEKEKFTELERKLEEMEAKISVEAKPKKEDFDEEDDYIDALTDWKTEQKLAEVKNSVEKSAADKSEQGELNETYDGLGDAMERGKEKYKNFNDLVLNEHLVISPEVTQIILDADVPEDVMYYLGSNPEKAEEISKLDSVRAAKEIGKIEVRLEKTEKIIKAKPKKKQSKAPSPIIPVKANGVTEKDPNKMSLKEYTAWRKGNK
jgi:hypothetical protein